MNTSVCLLALNVMGITIGDYADYAVNPAHPIVRSPRPPHDRYAMAIHRSARGLQERIHIDHPEYRDALNTKVAP